MFSLPGRHWLLDIWYARQRRLDLDLLWPACKEKAKDLDHAKVAFAFHAFHDKAWLWLGEDHIRQILKALE
jgi:hypothetical protein